MPKRNARSGFLDKLQRKVFEATGFPLKSLLRLAAFAIIAAVGIAWTVLYVDAEQNGTVSETETIESQRLTSEEQFVNVSSLPDDFSQKRPVERIDILKSKIEAGESLARSGGHYSERATDQLIICLLYTSPSPRDS